MRGAKKRPVRRKGGYTYLNKVVPHAAQFVKAFFVGADEKNCNFVRRLASATSRPLMHRCGWMLKVEEADIHVEVASVVEAGQTQRNPILTASGLDTAGFKQHVKYQMEIARVE